MFRKRDQDSIQVAIDSLGSVSLERRKIDRPAKVLERERDGSVADLESEKKRRERRESETGATRPSSPTDHRGDQRFEVERGSWEAKTTIQYERDGGL